MSKRFTFASPLRVHAVLCCAVAVLLSACGGSADETDSQQSLAATIPNETAVTNAGAVAGHIAIQPAAGGAVSAPAATEPAPAVTGPAPALAGPTPADTTVVSETPAAAGESGAAPASGEFNLSGYQQTPAAGSTGAGGEGNAASGASGQPATQPFPPY